MRTINAIQGLLSVFLLGLASSCGPAPETTEVKSPTPQGTAAQAPAGEKKAEATPAAPRKTPRADATLIPRSVLFGNPDRLSPRVSPDGKRIAFLAPSDGVMNVWVGPADDVAAAKPVTQEKTRAIRRYFWTYTSDHVVYLQDKGGDENWHALSVDLKANKTQDLTPIDGIAAQIAGLSAKSADEILIGINDRDKKHHDLYRVNIRSGEKKLVQKNEAYASFVADDDYKVRLATRMLPDGSVDLVEPDGKDGFKLFSKIPQEDTVVTEPVGFDAAGNTLFMLDSRGRDTAAFIALDWKSRKPAATSADPKADTVGLLLHPKSKQVQAVSSAYERKEWRVIDPKIKPHLDALRAVDKGDIDVLSRSLDDRRWTVAFILSDGPVRYYLYETDKKKASFLFTNLKALEGLKLTPMHPRVIKARDGLELVSYLSLPLASDPDGDGKPDKALPTTLLVHGGPWGRDAWGFNSMHQWLTNRGYAVLSVNFRGSVGFGKKFTNAADKEWAGKMHDDLLDAVGWAVRENIADKDKVAIMGGSYGGYATLVGLTFTPEAFACGVDIVGPSNLITLLQTIPPYWAPMLEMFTTRVGDHRTEEGKKLLASRSPLTFVDRIKRPLLIGQGANDPRVKQAESDQIVKAMQEKRIPVTYVLYPDEGHGFARPENRLSFNAVAETFLAQCLGGAYQPVGDDFKGSSIAVPAGASEIHGLAEALPKR
jgi:dipeptidyl aminopeptidase/acylaminoacyl peptidase